MSIVTKAMVRGRGLSRRRFLDDILVLLPWFMLITLGGIASFFTDDFLTPTNLGNVLQHAAPLGIMVVGEALCLMVGYMDLTVESTLVLSAVACAWLITDHPLASGLHVNPYLGIVAMLACGSALGLLQGFLIVKVKANPMVTTLALSVLLRGIAMIWVRGGGIFPMPDAFRVVALSHVGPVPTPVIVFFAVYIALYVFLVHLPLGRSIYAVGGNKVAAQASGVNINKVMILAFTISGFTAALAGVLLCGRMNTASLSLSSGRIFDVFAAAVIGGVSLQGGKGNALGALGGVLLLVVISNLLSIFNFASHLVEMVRGAVILTAALIDALRWRAMLSGGS